MRAIVLPALLWLPLLLPGIARADILVGAASSVREPLEQIVREFRQTSDAPVTISYGASGRLTHQILLGAPFDLFLSADADYPERVVAAGLSRAEPVTYAVGTIVLYDAGGGACGNGARLETLVNGASSGDINRIAIANPDLAPYGKAARQALETSGVWEAIQPNLVYANNVAQAAQYSLTGAVDCALIARSIALSEAFQGSGLYTEVDQSLYAPVRHSMILLSPDEGSAALFDYLQSSAARSVFEAAGFQRTGG